MCMIKSHNISIIKVSNLLCSLLITFDPRFLLSIITTLVQFSGDCVQ